MADINPAMLTVAREARGMTQAELAVAVAVSQAKISKYEAGFLRVSDNDVAAFSLALDFPPEFFFQTDKVYGFGSSCFYHRKRMRMPVTELRKLQARLNIFRFHVTRLMRGVEIETQNQFIRLDVDEHGGPEEVARALRSAWNLPMGPVASVVDAVEAAGAIVYAMPLGTHQIDAISQVAPGCPPLIFVNSDSPGDRLRFTLMHEVGHIVMHQLPSDDMESQADRFAAEFLLPSAELKGALRQLRLQQLPPLKTQWKVSMAALIKRAYDLKQISERQYRSLFTEMSVQGWRTREPVEIDVESPEVFDRILDTHLNEHRFTVTELARMVNSKESRFEAYLKRRTPGGLRIVG